MIQGPTVNRTKKAIARNLYYRWYKKREERLFLYSISDTLRKGRRVQKASLIALLSIE